jgi:hypothetical protein
VKHSVSNGKRRVSNVNKRAKMFAVCAWTQIAVFVGDVSVSLIASVHMNSPVRNGDHI